MKIEEVIKQLESIADHTRSMAASLDADEIWKEDSDALEFALTALRSMQEAGEPLSLEQLREMDGKPVWIVEYPDWGHWELSEDANDYIVDRNLNFYGMKHDDPDGRYGLHKLGWLAYSYPPAHIDRSEWISVKERLPERFEHVLVYCKKHRGDIFVSCGYRYDNTGWYVDGIYTTVVTHWMPLPEPPEEG